MSDKIFEGAFAQWSWLSGEPGVIDKMTIKGIFEAGYKAGSKGLTEYPKNYVKDLEDTFYQLAEIVGYRNDPEKMIQKVRDLKQSNKRQRYSPRLESTSTRTCVVSMQMDPLGDYVPYDAAKDN